MAKSKPVSEHELEAPIGKARHVKLLARFVAQQGLAAIEALERCIIEGSPKMKAAAWEWLAQLDEARAEGLALSAADEPGPKKSRLQALALVATPACLRRLASQAPVSMKALTPGGWVRAAAWLPEGYARAREAGMAAERSWASALMDALEHEEARVESLLQFSRSLTSPASASPELCAMMLDRLIHLGDLPTCRRADLSTFQFEAASRRLPPDECFDRLAPRIRSDEVILWELLSVLGRPDADPRWVELLGALKSQELRVTALCSLTSSAALEALLVEAAQLPWGRSMKEVLHALGKFDDSRCAALLMHWLNTPEGLEVAPLLLTALRRSGRAEDVPVLTALAARDELNRAFYAATIEAIG